MDEITTVKVIEAVLIRIVGVGPMIEIVSRRVFYPILITSILERLSIHMEQQRCKKLTWYSSSLYIKGVMAQPWLVQWPV